MVCRLEITRAGVADLDALFSARYGAVVPLAAYATLLVQVGTGKAWAFHDRQIDLTPLMLGGIFTAGGETEAWFLEGANAARRMKPLVREMNAILDAEANALEGAMMTRVSPINPRGGKLAHLLGFVKTRRLEGGCLVWERRAS